MKAEYEKLAQEFEEALVGVDAPLDDYIEALDEIISSLKSLRNAAEEDKQDVG